MRVTEAISPWMAWLSAMPLLSTIMVEVELWVLLHVGIYPKVELI